MYLKEGGYIMQTVSIIVPIYNTAKVLNRLIDSLVNQTYRDLEIILVDDGSTDGSSEICEQRKLSDSRIVVIHKENGGETSARNAGLAVATGSYINFCDSDDELPLYAIQALVSKMRDDIDLVFGSYLVVENDGSRLACALRECYTISEVAYDVLMDHADYRTIFIMYACNAKLYKTKILKEHAIKFNTDYNIEACAEFVIDYLKCCSGKIINLFIYTYIYYRNLERPQSLSYLYPDKFEYLNRIVAEYVNLISDATLKKKLFPSLYQIHIDTMIAELVHAAAYYNYFDNFYNNINEFLNTPLIRESISIYKRKRYTDSRLIPFFMKYNMIKELVPLLYKYGEKYIERNGRRTAVKMIFCRNNKMSKEKFR